MSDRFFIDTNIFIYFIDHSSPKQQISRQIILSALQSGAGIISTQVVQEFLNVATGKIPVPLKKPDALEILQSVLIPLCQIYPDHDLFMETLDIRSNTGYSFYDSLILAAAVRGDCNLLLTEDLQSGQLVMGVKIINPYQPDFDLCK